MPGVTLTCIWSPNPKLWSFLHTTVPTTFSILPVISVFVGFKLCFTPEPCPTK